MNCSFICKEWTVEKLKLSRCLENSDLELHSPILRPSGCLKSSDLKALKTLVCLENSDLKLSDPLGEKTNLENSDLKNSDPLGVSRNQPLKTGTLTGYLKKLRPLDLRPSGCLENSDLNYFKTLWVSSKLRPKKK